MYIYSPFQYGRRAHQKALSDTVLQGTPRNTGEVNSRYYNSLIISFYDFANTDLKSRGDYCEINRSTLTEEDRRLETSLRPQLSLCRVGRGEMKFSKNHKICLISQIEWE